MNKTVALIPARGGSKSIPLKNIREMNRRPMIYWTLDAACGCPGIDSVYVATDSPDIWACVEAYGHPRVHPVSRSPETATDTASTESVMLEFAENHDFETIILIQATSPLLESSHLSDGLQRMKQGYDSVLSVTRQKRFVWQDSLNGAASINYDVQSRPMRQSFDGFLVENGAFYITTRQNLLQSKCRLSGKIGLTAMPEETYFEVDEATDWLIVEGLLRRRSTGAERPGTLPWHNIKAVFTDCDGVLTDGGMYYTENGDEIKRFHARDGMAFRLLREAGIITGVITGEDRQLLLRRCDKVKADVLRTGVMDKLTVLHELLEKYGIRPEETAYIGDDVNDLDVVQAVGIGCCVPDAAEVLTQSARYITRTKGGSGAFREIADLILKAKKSVK